MALRLTEAVRVRLCSEQFVCGHRHGASAFTRHRLLTFPRVILLVLQKGVQSLQGRLAEFQARLAALSLEDSCAWPVSPAAWSQARAKLSHPAFIALNEEAVLPSFYDDPEAGATVRRWRGHRLCAIDGSVLQLPATQALASHFGWAETANGRGAGTVRHVQALASVYFDVLNRLGLDARLEAGRTGERALGGWHAQAAMRPGDVVLTDRGYCGLGWFLRVRQSGANFICRVPRRCLVAAEKLFAANQEDQSLLVVLTSAAMQPRADLPPGALAVRLLTVRLATGELEVLATSLLEEALYPTDVFKEAYGLRWGIETYDGRLKGHLEVARFSGHTLEAVRQDFFASVFLANVESLLSAPAQARLDATNAQRQHPAQVNRAGSFHALKLHALALFGSDLPAETILHKLTQPMGLNPVAQRQHRSVERKPPSQRRSLWHWRYQRRHTS